MLNQRTDEELLQHISCVVFDVETTGLGGHARILEIAAVRLEAWQPVAELQTLVKPGVPISSSASQVHQITEDMVVDAPTFADVAPAFAHLLQDAVLVGHNIFSFDLRFIKKELRGIFGTGPNNWAVDTLPLARKLMEGTSHTLEGLSATLGIPLVAHHAMSDVYATAELWMHLVRVLMRRGGKQLFDVSRFKALKQLDGAGLPRFEEAPSFQALPRT